MGADDFEIMEHLDGIEPAPGPNPSNSDLVGERIGSQAMEILYEQWAFEERDTASQRRVKTFVLGLLGRYAELAQQLEQAEQRITKAETLLTRADEHEFNGTTAKNGDAHQLVKQARAALTPDEGADPGGR